MHSPREQRRHIILDNIIWFTASIALAILVWITATLASNPVEVFRFPEKIPIDILIDENVIITNTPTNLATVFVRTQGLILEELAADDIQITADLRGIETFGRITVPLKASISRQRQATIDTLTPSQITVVLERRQERLIPLELAITGDPPISYEAQPPELTLSQILITGPSASVSQVVTALVAIDLTDRRESQEIDIRPQLIDAEGNTITGLTLSPETVNVSLQIEPRSDVKEVRVTPNLIGTLPSGYTLNGDFSYTPQSVFVSGSREALANLPGTLLTSPIDLSTYTDDFDIRVQVELTNPDLALITGQRINVSVGIDPIQSSRQFEQIPLEVTNLAEGLSAIVTPQNVTVLVNGPQPILENLADSAVRVIVDASSITQSGTYQIEPVAIIDADAIDSAISVIPVTVDLEIVALEANSPPQ